MLVGGQVGLRSDHGRKVGLRSDHERKVGLRDSWKVWDVMLSSCSGTIKQDEGVNH